MARWGSPSLDVENEGKDLVHTFYVLTVDTLNVSGCASIDLSNTIITTFNGTGHNVNVFDFENIAGLTDIYIIDNPLLLNIVWATTPVQNNVTISGNPLLDESVGWKTQNVSNLVLTGSFNDTFSVALDMMPNFVLGDFLLNLTGYVDCGSWDSLRPGGRVLGNYSCQGETVAIKKSGAVSNAFRSVIPPSNLQVIQSYNTIASAMSMQLQG